MNRGWPSGRRSRLIPYFSSAALELGADNGPRPRWLRPLRGSLLTLCWRRESRANPSQRGVLGPWQYGTIPKGLWMITEAEKGYFGLENGGISVFAPWQLLLLSR